MMWRSTQRKKRTKRENLLLVNVSLMLEKEKRRIDWRLNSRFSSRLQQEEISDN